MICNGSLPRTTCSRFATKDDLQGGIQGLELRLTLRFGALVVAGVAALAVLDRF